MDIYHKYTAHRNAIIKIWKQGGFYERIMDSGPELDRVKLFLRIIEGLEPGAKSLPFQHPTFLPVFPDIRAKPFHSRENDEVAMYLEKNFEPIQMDIIRAKEHALNNTNLKISWKVNPLWYLGINICPFEGKFKNIEKIMLDLPKSAQKFPLAEAIVSWLDPGAHLPAHNSTDGLRCRYSLGVIVDDFCELRVANQRQQWKKKECIVFEDCFEHEAFNGQKERAVLIIDTWHPDLTNIEIEALTAGFYKYEVRKLLYYYRPIEAIKNIAYKIFKQQDKELSDKYWNLDSIIDQDIPEEILEWKNISVQFGNK